MAKILLVDDDLQMANMVEDWLAFEGHSIDAVNSGLLGWEKLRGGKYDLLILDWDLPDLNGIDILKRYRASGGESPVLMLTGHTNVSDKELGLDAGADDYLTKPFHMKELTARLKALMRRAEPKTSYVKPLGSGNEDILKLGQLAGTQLAARYEFVDVLGHGGMGLVFKAIHPLMEKFVAIKMLLSSELAPESIERFKREAKAVSRLDHHNVVTVHDFGVTEHGLPYMVMEFIEGKSLEDLLAEEGPLPLVRALEICAQSCEGVGHAHEMGVLHRDIKPGNIMLKVQTGNRETVRVLDFGFAKLKEPDSKKAVALTQVGTIMGSPPYMSPEQVRGKPLDERSDVYSMGCVIYETVCGRPPHTGQEAMEVMLKHLEEPIAPISTWRPDLPAGSALECLVFRALQLDPACRFQSMVELADELRAIQRKIKSAAGGT